MPRFLKKHLLFIIFTVLYFAFSFLTYKDYGNTFDEVVEYESGRNLFSYYSRPTTIPIINDSLTNVPGRIELRQIPLFSTYSRVYPMVLSLLNPRDFFEWYHLLNLCFGYALFLISYTLFYLIFKNPAKAVAAPILLVLNPYIFGHIPANPKDIPFATLYLLGFFLIYFLNNHVKNNVIRVFIFGLVFGLVQSFRAVGLSLILINFLYVLCLEKKLRLSNIFETLLIFVTSIPWMILSLPFLGVNLPANFLYILSNASGYKDWNNLIFYFGKFLTKTERPWHYLPILLLIKLNVLTIIFFIIAKVCAIKTLIRSKKISDLDFLFLSTIGINFIIYLITHPVVYNGLRHFLYLLVLIVLYSTICFIKFVWSKKFVVFKIGTGLYLLLTLCRMIALHPYEYIYYNEAIGGIKGAAQYFELDYWGASYKEGSEYIRSEINKNNLSQIKVYTCDNPIGVVYYSDFKFDLVSRSKDADYIICDTFRDSQRDYHQSTQIVHEIKRENTPILYIRKFLDRK